MHSSLVAILSLTLVSWQQSSPSTLPSALPSDATAPPPLVAKYLYAGTYGRGEKELERALELSPKDDQIRYGLGVLRILQTIERFGQALHEYGAKSDSAVLPMGRLPIPENKDPAPITYLASRRIVEDFLRGLENAEQTLTGIKDENVKLTLNVSAIKFDLDGDGTPEVKLVDILHGMMQRQFEFLKRDPNFTVSFDRGDVAWLRSYCHLISGIGEIYLSLGSEEWFNSYAHKHFGRLKKTSQTGNGASSGQSPSAVAVAETVRWHRFRMHMLQVCKLNHETWEYILKETDDEHEWLPNPKQTGVFGMPIRQEMVSAWLAMVDEIHALLEGKKLIPVDFLYPKEERGLNLKTLLESPPEDLNLRLISEKEAGAKYLEKGDKAEIGVFIAAFQMFDAQPFPYFFWFN